LHDRACGAGTADLADRRHLNGMTSERQIIGALYFGEPDPAAAVSPIVWRPSVDNPRDDATE
jgi:hypothetical protein